ncbi:unnamed protein product [Rhizoctonia solani]|uniref:Ubiquitin-like domain-containing protein n=1 Tax=Rhizoctonia solani TaxID=456999 RepID=A0A8H3BLW7_9AGAM|nr:unnamed protein product [Rhizoctonia solani]
MYANTNNVWRTVAPRFPLESKQNKSPFIAVEYSSRKVAILRSTSYMNTIASIKKAFGELQQIANQRIQLFVKIDQIDDLVQVIEELWTELVPFLSLLTVAKTEAIEPLFDNHIQVRVKPELGMEQTFNVTLMCTLPSLRSMVQERMPHGPRGNDFSLFYDGRLMTGTGALVSYGVEDGCEIQARRGQRVEKPVIYLFSPSPLQKVHVDLSLVRGWHFSAIYPHTPITSPPDNSFGEAISWTVDTRSDGSLFDQLTNREVAYLFWEAHTKPGPFISPPTTPSAELAGFDPARPIVLPSHSALLPFSKVTGYIDDALLAMRLHAEARTSFITYWLPNLSKHSHIALRFLPQDQYEAAAPLHVTPVPEIVTRVFMLFMGVQESDLGSWKSARIPAQEWSRVIGVDTEKAKDVTLFRVLEWGGMEIQ